ncbi:hypothetical protein ACO1O0_003009 [Amphichorda felina]
MALAEKRTLRHGELGEHQGLNGLAVFKNNRKDMVIDVENPKVDWYFKLSPNGRVPAIVDPNNNDLVLWESGAILEYLVDTYDKENKLNVTDFADKWHLKQYLHFQMSGQGPYFGQFVWFSVYHQESFPSAKARYEKEIVRVVGVLNDILKGKEYLVGGKVTYADIAFIPWNRILNNDKLLNFVEKYELKEKYPDFYAWNERLLSRPAVKKVLGIE